MMRFQKNSNLKKSIKKLNLRDVWKLYKTLKSGMAQKSDKYFMDEIINVMSRISEDDFIDSIGIMYGWGANKGKSPVELGLMFSAGIRKNHVFEFKELVRGLSK